MLLLKAYRCRLVRTGMNQINGSDGSDLMVKR